MCIGWIEFKSQWFIVNGPQVLTRVGGGAYVPARRRLWESLRPGEKLAPEEAASLPGPGPAPPPGLPTAHLRLGFSSLRVVLPAIYSPLEPPRGRAWGDSVQGGCGRTALQLLPPPARAPQWGEWKTPSCMNNRLSPLPFWKSSEHLADRMLFTLSHSLRLNQVLIPRSLPFF